MSLDPKFVLIDSFTKTLQNEFFSIDITNPAAMISLDFLSSLKMIILFVNMNLFSSKTKAANSSLMSFYSFF